MSYILCLKLAFILDGSLLLSIAYLNINKIICKTLYWISENLDVISKESPLSLLPTNYVSNAYLLYVSCPDIKIESVAEIV